MLIPVVIDKTAKGERSYDIYSRLLEDRIVFISNEINTDVANTVIAQLLYLESKDPNKDIHLYINSVGGEVYAGFSIVDTMNYIKCDVSTICVGLAASMASFILASGAKGKRFILPSSRVMIHQPLSPGMSGQVSDLDIRVKEAKRLKEEGIKLFADITGKSAATIEKDMDRDNFLLAGEAIDYGLVDKILIRDKKAPKAGSSGSAK